MTPKTPKNGSAASSPKSPDSSTPKAEASSEPPAATSALEALASTASAESTTSAPTNEPQTELESTSTKVTDELPAVEEEVPATSAAAVPGETEPTEGKFYAIRKSDKFSGPALFLNVEDYNNYMTDENKEDCKEFDVLSDALTYILHGQATHDTVYQKLQAACVAASASSSTAIAKASSSKRKRSASSQSSLKSSSKQSPKKRKVGSNNDDSNTNTPTKAAATSSDNISTTSERKRKTPPIIEKWDEMIEELIKFKTQHGHAKVPTTKGKDGRSDLQKFVQSVRTYYKKLQDSNGIHTSHILTPERIAQLEGLDFQFRILPEGRLPGDQQWNKRYEELKRFKETNGHMRVSRHTDPQLWGWIKTQRARYRNTTNTHDSAATTSEEGTKQQQFHISPERIAKLQVLGFQWNVQQEDNDAAWENQFVELLKFKATTGHCRVPKNFPSNTKLSNWVFGQRQAYSKWIRTGKLVSSLGDDRIKRLNEIGFEWRLNTPTPGTAATTTNTNTTEI